MSSVAFSAEFRIRVPTSSPPKRSSLSGLVCAFIRSSEPVDHSRHHRTVRMASREAESRYRAPGEEQLLFPSLYKPLFWWCEISEGALAEVLHTNLHRSNQGTSIPFRPDIEGLRALAVGLVIASHAGVPFLRSGFVGVDVFFVLSGYLITGLLMQEISSSGTVNFARFYARRARRLLPAAITMVLVVCIAEAIIKNPVAQFSTLKSA